MSAAPSPTPPACSPQLVPEDHDFQLYTDGSGHEDMFGGFAAVLLSSRYDLYEFRAAAVYGISVARAEFEALLLGLQTIFDKMGWMKGLHRQRLEAGRATVYWLSDREDLVRSVAPYLTPDGWKQYGRNANLDLWARLDWYAQYLDVRPVHKGRNLNAWQALTDRVSSECRAVIKNYVGVLESDGVI